MKLEWKSFVNLINRCHSVALVRKLGRGLKCPLHLHIIIKENKEKKAILVLVTFDVRSVSVMVTGFGAQLKICK